MTTATSTTTPAAMNGASQTSAAAWSRRVRLWLDHLVHIPRYRPVGWALTIGPVLLVATMSGFSLAATTGIACGVLLLGTAAAGFHDLAGIRPARSSSPDRLSAKAR